MQVYFVQIQRVARSIASSSLLTVESFAIWGGNQENISQFNSVVGVEPTLHLTFSEISKGAAPNFEQNVLLHMTVNPDARHRFVFAPLYELPFKGNRFFEGWRLSGILSLQSGSPMTLVNGVSSTAFTGVSTNRPELIGPVRIVNQIIKSGPNAGLIQWLTPNSVCDPSVAACAPGMSYAIPAVLSGTTKIFHFGNVRRNSVPGPDFKNLD